LLLTTEIQQQIYEARFILSLARIQCCDTIRRDRHGVQATKAPGFEAEAVAFKTEAVDPKTEAARQYVGGVAQW